MVEEEGDDAEAVTKLLQLNETIKADLEKYDKLRKGDFQGAQQVTIKPMYSRLWWVMLIVERVQGKPPMAVLPVLLTSMASWVVHNYQLHPREVITLEIFSMIWRDYPSIVLHRHSVKVEVYLLDKIQVTSPLSNFSYVRHVIIESVNNTSTSSIPRSIPALSIK